MEKLYSKLSESLSCLGRWLNQHWRRVVRLIALPIYFSTTDWSECTRSRLHIAGDLLYIFFVLRYYPDNYAACRLWDISRDQWPLFYGSMYNPIPRYRIRAHVQHFSYAVILSDKEVCSHYCEGVNLPQPQLLGTINTFENPEVVLKSIMTRNKLDRVIVKPALGSAGDGIVLAEVVDQGIAIRTPSATHPIADHIFNNRYVVQNIVPPLPELSLISPGALSTIRVVTILDRNGNVVLLGACMRVGREGSFIDNWSAGGLAVGVDETSGQLLKYAYDKHGRRYKVHPDTDVVFHGFQVPMWSSVIALAERTQQQFEYFRLIGSDIAVTADGPILIEINAEPDLVLQEQTSGPILSRPKALKVFHEYNLLFNKKQRDLVTAELKSTH